MPLEIADATDFAVLFVIATVLSDIARRSGQPTVVSVDSSVETIGRAVEYGPSDLRRIR